MRVPLRELNFNQRAHLPIGGVEGMYGGVLGWVSEKHPPANFALFISVLRDLGGCWGVFAKKLKKGNRGNEIAESSIASAPR